MPKIKGTRKQISDTIQERSSSDSITGLIWDIKRYALHDGPGIRTTVFLKGCPLQCLWCCNPESQNFHPEILWLEENCIRCNLCLEICPTQAIYEEKQGKKCINYDRCDLCALCVNRCPGEALQLVGKRVTVQEVLQEIVKDDVFYSRTSGGLTLSGGEPAAQPDFAYELLRQYKIKEKGLHSTIDTCGYVDWHKLNRFLEYTDLILYDIKHMNPQEHTKLTGVSNKLILQNARRIAESHKRLIIRLPIIPGYNDTEENILKTAAFARSLPGVEEIDILPYHALGKLKYARLCREYRLFHTLTLPLERVVAIRSIVENFGLRVRIGG